MGRMISIEPLLRTFSIAACWDALPPILPSGFISFQTSFIAGIFATSVRFIESLS